MISVQKLKQAISESKELGVVIPIQRDRYMLWLKESINNKLIKAVVGFRRSGKSFMLKLLSKELISRNVPTSNIFYLNFENDLLNNIKTVESLRHIWEIYLREIADPTKEIYIIWDEIQLVKSWEKLVRSLYEQGRYNIFISGSNSNLLSGELSSTLSGRCISLEIMPFSFNEYLDFLNINSNSYYEDKRKIDTAFKNYLMRGGIAEQFNLNESFLNNYQSGLIKKIILDDN